MAPTAVTANIPANDLADLKAKSVAGHVEVEVTPAPPVADNFMYDFKYNHSLPTIDVLGRDVPDDVDALQQAHVLTDRLAQVLGSGDGDGFADMFLGYGQCLSSGPRAAN